jgi:hypothetical protein
VCELIDSLFFRLHGRGLYFLEVCTFQIVRYSPKGKEHRRLGKTNATWMDREYPVQSMFPSARLYDDKEAPARIQFHNLYRSSNDSSRNLN